MDKGQEEGGCRAEIAYPESDPEESLNVSMLVVDQWRQVVIDRPHELVSEQHHPERKRQLLVREPQAHDSLLHYR